MRRRRSALRISVSISRVGRCSGDAKVVVLQAAVPRREVGKRFSSLAVACAGASQRRKYPYSIAAGVSL